MTRTAEHRLNRAPRVKDSIVALDMFAGVGGSSQGIEAAGIDVWYAANHNPYAIDIHEANHPRAEHFVADLVDETKADYYHPEQLPAADVLWASPSCVNHSPANAQKAYALNLSLFDVHDAEYEQRVTDSERSRATAVCVLQYARKHRPQVIAVENVVEFARWGYLSPTAKRGDGTTFRWWLAEFAKLGYEHEVLFLNSMFFGVPQSRDRMYVAFWQKGLRRPDLAHRPAAFCSRCDTVVESTQTFKSGRDWPLARWGKYGAQYVYRCPSCASELTPPTVPAAAAIDWSDLGTRIGDRATPLAPNTIARIERGIRKFGEWPPLLVKAKSSFGSDTTVASPLYSQTGQQDTMLVSAMQVVVAGNTFEREGSTCRVRPMTDVMWTQHGTNAHAMVVAPFVDSFVGAPRAVAEPLPTQVGNDTQALVVPWLMTERGTSPERTPTLVDPLVDAMTTVTAGGNHHFLLSAAFAKQNGSSPNDTAWHPFTDPLNTLLGVDTTAMIASQIADIDVLDCMYRMLKPTEIKAGMGFESGFVMWGTGRQMVKGLGNAVTPPVATWIADRLTAVLK